MSINLIPGNPYFVVLFKDRNLSIPVIRTLVFEKTFMRGDKLSCLFKIIPFDDSEEIDFFIDSEHVSHLVVNQDGLLKRLEE